MTNLDGEIVALCQVDDIIIIDVQRFSQFGRLLCVTTLVLRFVTLQC